MTNTTTVAPLLLCLTPALLALLLYGLGQDFVKMWSTEVPPAHFCLYFARARAVVMRAGAFVLTILPTGVQHAGTSRPPT